MAIDSFLKEYRDYMYTKKILIDQIDSSSSSSDIYVITHHCVNILKELQTQMTYLDRNLVDIEKEIDSVFENVYKKIDKIEDIAEGYQNLNTNELTTESIKSFRAFKIQDRSLYDDYYKGLTLPRTNTVTNLVPTLIDRSNIDAKEYYRNLLYSDDFFIKIKTIDKNKTIIKKVNLYSKDEKLIEEVYDKSLIKVPKEVSTVVIYSDNTSIDNNSYTSIDILNDTFLEKDSVTLTEETFLKEGNLFKLNIDYEIPTQSYVTIKLIFKFKNKETNKNEQVIIYTSLNNNRDILIEKNESKPNSTLKDIYNNNVNIENISNNQLVFSPEYSTNKNLINHIGNKVFNISNLKTDSFNLSVSFSLYSLIDKTKTPLIKGIYGYVTD